MKKYVWIVALIAALAMVMTGCPEEGGGGGDDWGYYFEDGQVKINLPNNAKLEEGKTYDVTLLISKIDADLVGGHFGGQIYAENSNEEVNEGKPFLLSGWKNGTPETVASGAKNYTWAFEGGNKNGDQGSVANYADIPATAKHYLQVTVQVPAWGTNITGKHGFNATLTIVQQPVYGALTLVRELNTTTDWDWRDNDTNKGKISSTAGDEIRALPDGSVLRVYISGKVYDDSGSPRPGWGVGKIGGDAAGVEIAVPGTATGSATGTDFAGYVDILIKSLPEESDEYGSGFISVNIWSDFTITKIEIWRVGA